MEEALARARELGRLGPREPRECPELLGMLLERPAEEAALLLEAYAAGHDAEVEARLRRWEAEPPLRPPVYLEPPYRG